MAGPEQTTATPRPRPREELELEITGLAHGGRGVARRDGYVVFVSGALPGDTVRAAVTKSKRRFAEARVVELLRPSPDRVPDRCDHGGEPCPGAPWQGLPYEQQLRHKSEQVDDALRRIGGLDGFELEPIEPAVEQWRYRNKLEYSFGERDGEPRARLPRPRALGPGRRRRGLPARLGAQQRRPQRDPRLGPATRPSRPTTAARSEGVLRNLVVREGRRTGAGPDPPRHLGRRDPEAARRPAHGDRGAGQRHRRPDGRARRASTSRRSSAAFASASRTAPSSRPTPRWPSASTASPPSSRSLTGAERLFDLFCGIGTLGLSMASRRRRGLGHRGGPRRHRRRRGERPHQRDLQRAVPRRRRAHPDPPAARGGRAPRRRRRRPPSRRPLGQDRPPADRVRGPADRLRLVQPDDARAECRPAHGGRI